MSDAKEDEKEQNKIDISRDAIGVDKTDSRNIERITSSKPIVKQQNAGRKAVNKFFGGDPKSVADRVFTDVILPGAKDLFVDFMTAGIKRLVYGDTSDDISRRRSSEVNRYTSYDRISTRRTTSATSRDRFTRVGYDIGNIILPTRDEAENVLSSMSDTINRYGNIRVADLYDMVGITSAYTDNNWGWTDIRHASISRVREGYLLDLPLPEAIR